ncbi:MAG: Crp/Fnr family transcriptional regulator [Planctomycetota bacterium]|jgi:CRP-like cAMP-binding protein
MVAAESLGRDPFFKALRPEAREALEPLSRRHSYHAGETIFCEGKETGPLRVLVKGLVSFRQSQPEAESDALMGSVARSGDIFGISALMGRGQAYPYTAVCLEETEVIEVGGDELMHLCEQRPEIGVHILQRLNQVMAERLAAAREQIRSRIRPGLISHG